MSRSSTSRRSIVDAVLLKSRRRCALCYASGDETPKQGNVVHIIPLSSGGTTGLDNLVFLCERHHAELDRVGRAGAQEHVRTARDALYRAVAAEPPSTSSRPKVFVVHGLDESAKIEVSRFLENAGIEPVVLSDQPSLGRTVLEKLEHAADAVFAVVLLTPDTRMRSPDQQRSVGAFARENVILELGFFIGRLGRRRVCALYKPPVELPSDIHGILYVEMDRAGRWRHMLTRELRDAGVPLAAI